MTQRIATHTDATSHPSGRFVLPTDRPLRILIGTKEVAGQIADYAAGFRALGHTVTTAVSERHAFFSDLIYDVDLSAPDGAKRIPELMRSHDVFVFQYGSSLLPNNLDLPLLQQAGKAVIAICNGDDVRHASAYAQQFGVAAATLGDTYVNDPLSRPSQTLRVFERYASLMVSVPNQAGLALRPYMHFAYPMDLSLYASHIPDRDVPVIVHAPSDRAVKGTTPILAALDRLAARGVQFEVQLIENAANATVRSALRDADIAIDQLFIGYGKFAAEAMASGCVAATAAYPDIEPLAQVRPTWRIASATLDADLERLVCDRASRRALAQVGRAHVGQFHDRETVCSRLLRALHAEQQGTLRYDYYPDFASTQYTLPPRAEFTRAQRVMASEIVGLFGADDRADLAQLARKGLLDVVPGMPSATVSRWTAVQGLTSCGVSGDAIAMRFNAIERTEATARLCNRAAEVTAHTSRIPQFFACTQPGGASVLARATNDKLRVYLQLGAPHLALREVLADSAHDVHARRASGLLLLGAGQWADARDMLDAARSADTDGVTTYYCGVAQALAGDLAGAGETLRAAIGKLPRQPEIEFFGSTPILTNKYWAMALREGGQNAQTLMGEYYGSINSRQDYDHYFADFMPLWCAPALREALAPFHAFLYLLLTARTLHTSFEGGPLGWTPMAAYEPALLKAAGIRTVVVGYGADCTVYSSVRDLSHRHAFLSSYPAAARNETKIRDRLDLWNAHADCIVTTIHSLDGHGRWDVLTPSPFHIDTTLWNAVAAYSEHDGRSGSVRVIHTPNHRGYKGSEFLVDAVRVLRAEGLQIDLDLIEGTPNSDVRARMQHADILAEQFIAPMYALSGIEGMATGIPVMANIGDAGNDVFRRFSFLDECPVMATSIEQLVPHLRRLVTEPTLRRALGVAGRAYVEKYHSFAEGRRMFAAIHAAITQEPNTSKLSQLYHPLLGSTAHLPRIVHPLRAA